MKKRLVFLIVCVSFLNAVSGNLFQQKFSKIKFYEKDKSVYEFAGPSSIVEISGDYYVLDSGNGVFQFNKERILVNKLYGIGQGPGEINSRTAFMLANGNNLYIPDTFNGRILIFNTITNKKSVIKSPEMTFVTNGVVKGNDIYFGSVNCIFKMKKDKSIEKINVNLGNPNESLIHLVTLKNNKLQTVSMMLHGKKLDKLYTFFEKSGKFQFEEFTLPKNEKLENWKKKNKFPLLFTSCVEFSENIYLTTKIFSEKEGTLVFKIGKNGKISSNYLKNISFALFSGKYVIDGDSATIFKF